MRQYTIVLRRKTTYPEVLWSSNSSANSLLTVPSGWLSSTITSLTTAQSATGPRRSGESGRDSRSDRSRNRSSASESVGGLSVAIRTYGCGAPGRGGGIGMRSSCCGGTRVDNTDSQTDGTRASDRPWMLGPASPDSAMASRRAFSFWRSTTNRTVTRNSDRQKPTTTRSRSFMSADRRHGVVVGGDGGCCGVGGNGGGSRRSCDATRRYEERQRRTVVAALDASDPLRVANRPATAYAKPATAAAAACPLPRPPTTRPPCLHNCFALIVFINFFLPQFFRQNDNNMSFVHNRATPCRFAGRAVFAFRREN